MKKIVALALCLVMVLGLMAGCEKAMDLDTLIQKMDEATKTVTAQSMDAELELEMEMSVTGMTMSIAMDMAMDVRTKTDLSAMYMDMTVAMEAMGESEETTMEIYATMEDGDMVSYTYETTSDTWVRSTQEDYADLMGQFTGMQQSMSELPKEQMVLAEEQITVNDRACYVLTLNMGGEQFQTYMSDYMGTMMSQLTGTGEELDEETKAMVEELDWTSLDASVVYHVDAETFLPLEMTMDVKGLGDVMNKLIGSMMGLAGEDAEEVEFSIDVPTMKMVMKNAAYNEAVEIPAVPQEAIDNAVDADELGEDIEIDDTGDDEMLTNPPQADGSYLLSMEQASASIVVPEGYQVFMSEPEMLVAMTEDMMMSVSYMLVPEVTGADMQTEFESMVEGAKEGGYWLSNSDAEEINGFTVKNLAYNDGTAEVYAWKELNGGVLMVSVASYADVPAVESVLNSVTINE